jgi:hypothetical protein
VRPANRQRLAVSGCHRGGVGLGRRSLADGAEAEDLARQAERAFAAAWATFSRSTTPSTCVVSF